MKFATSAAIFAAGLCALLVASTPAVLLDTALDHVSTGRFRLALVEGSLWNGQGRLASVDSSESLTPLSRLRWAFDPLSLAGASLRWQLQIDGAAPATLEISLGGLALHDLAAQLPPTAALAAFPHAIARVGWRGVLDLRIPALSCTWSGLCEGRIQAEWRAGGVDILPGQALGDHRIEATIGTSGTMLEITALRGLALVVNGTIGLHAGRRLQADLDIGGDTQLLDRLRGMLDEFGSIQDGLRLRIRS